MISLIQENNSKSDAIMLQEVKTNNTTNYQISLKRKVKISTLNI